MSGPDVEAAQNGCCPGGVPGTPPGINWVISRPARPRGKQPAAGDIATRKASTSATGPIPTKTAPSLLANGRHPDLSEHSIEVRCSGIAARSSTGSSTRAWPGELTVCIHPEAEEAVRIPTGAVGQQQPAVPPIAAPSAAATSSTEPSTTV